MDPSVYARAHGVQSESNNVTVTRVACGEIMYRRAVDTYRRDMKYKLNHLRKEQKRLRGCMRGYRRKLRESHQGENDKLMHETTTGECHKNLKTSVIVHHSSNKDSSEIIRDSSHTFFNNGFAHTLPDKTRTRPNATSAPLTEKKALLVEDNSKTLSARSCDPSFSQYTTGHQQADNPIRSDSPVNQANDETIKRRPVVMEHVGRTVRIGSGKIGALSRQIHVSIADSELEDDAFEDVSDSSDEEGGDREKDAPIDVVSFRNGMFIREITPLTLMRGNGAYFKSAPKEVRLDKKDNGDQQTKISVCGSEEALPVTVDFPDSTSYSGTRTYDIKKEEGINQTESSQTALPSIPLKSALVASTQLHQKVNVDKPKTEESVGSKRKKEKEGVSFNDIIKIQISNNTKKLFSLVDRLAKTSGIPENPAPQKSKDRFIKKDPRENVAIMRRAQAAKTGFGAPGPTTHDSVYYAIKYGYLSDAEIPDQIPDISRPTSRGSREQDRTLTSVAHSISTRSHHLSDSETISNTMSIISLSKNEDTEEFRRPQIYSESEGGSHLHNKAHDDDIGTELDSLLSEQKEKQRDRRRSSILEASKFVTANRRRRNSNVNYRVFPSVSEHSKREKELFIRPRRDATKPEHIEVSHDHKEPWTSAFGRIKMMHTLVELADIL
ncbi:hypothetical protein EGW08_016591 [Elysia chlorotica]|uniref:Uncharacterized protein n=1 Tax=Elysia chlorotica TaxID=188477 RepID=A0A3S0ZIL5_ELYCH|nr:hypothetical protein EGW08_016591 [Elysia chlorotica]